MKKKMRTLKKMTAGIEDDGIPCTIWLKKLNGEYLGCLAKANGELTRTGAFLLEKFTTLDAVKTLVEKRVIWSVKNASASEDVEFNPECRESLMKMQAREHGEYCYIFDEATSTWLFGVNATQRLSSLMKFIQR